MSREIVAPPDRVAEFLLHPLAQGLLDSVSDGIVILDAGDRRVVAMNAKARELLDYDEDEVLGSHCAEVMNSPACTLACPLTALVDGRPKGGELDLFYRGRSGDKLVHAHARMILVRDPQGEPLAGIEIFTDLRRVRDLEKRLGDRRSRGLVGGSKGMQRVFDAIEQIAPYDVPLIITGEHGVGKELVASGIHQASRRAGGPYVRMSCGELPTELAASQLFGHARDAFPGAGPEHEGAFEEADGGTLVLDEVFDLSPEVQAKLVRALEDGEVQRLGEPMVHRFDVRVIGLTSRDPDELVGGQLYDRLKGASIHVPPLRERSEDVVPLAAHFARAIGEELGRGEMEISPEVAAELQSRSWPGNARELQRRLRVAAGRAAGREIRLEHLDEESVPSTASEPQRFRDDKPRTLAAVEQEAIDDALRRADDNMAEAAKLLGIHRSTLWRKVKDRKRS